MLTFIPSLLDELASAGVKVVNKGDVDCVVVGLDRKFNYGKLSKAMLYVKTVLNL